jgi:hypothetical protein
LKSKFQRAIQSLSFGIEQLFLLCCPLIMIS